MSVEEKNFMKLQKEKQHATKKYSSIFNLEDDDSELLTHQGSVLGSSNIQDNSWADDTDDNNLQKDVVNALHFGGGFVQKASDLSGVSGTQQKNKLDAQDGEERVQGPPRRRET